MAQTTNKKTTSTKKSPTSTNKGKPENALKQKETTNNNNDKKPSQLLKVKPSRVSKWTKALLKKRIAEWETYITKNELTPTLQSFFLFIPKRTINNWKNNVDQAELWDTYMDRVHVVVENHMINKMLSSNSNSVAASIFYMKSVFKYSDRQEETGDQYQIQLNLDNNGDNKLTPTHKKPTKKEVKND